MHNKWLIIILLGLGLLTRFMFFGYPGETVFDEVHFGKFISGYYTGEYFFDIHPPLGKLAIAGFAKLFDFEPGFAFAEIGNAYPDKQYMILRFLPALAGALLPLVIFLLLITLGVAPLFAFAGGVFIVLENALLTQSHYILLDSFLLLFGFSALLFYFKSQRNILHKTLHHANPSATIKKWGGFGTSQAFYLLLFGFASGLAVSIKWTGLSFLVLPLIIEFIKIVRTKEYKDILKLGLPIIIAFVIYFSLFTLHFILLNKSGPGDAFMSIPFQKTLDGSRYANDPVNESNLFQKFSELNIQMYQANQNLDATHPYSSTWYSWPFMTRTIYYWVNGDARIYLIGNPIIWWSSTFAIIFILTSLFHNFKFSIRNPIIIFLLTGYVLNMLPFIGVSRVMFLYHYFAAYIFSVMALVWLLSQNKNSKIIFGVMLAAGLILFIYFAPLNYGLKLSSESYESRLWLESWR